MQSRRFVGGLSDPASGRPWGEDTIVHVWSTTKGLWSIGFAKLADEGRISYDDKVAKHWPEFAANGKQDVTIAHVLSHQSGVHALAVPTTIDDLSDFKRITDRLAAQAPFWKPGEDTSYHAMTWGFILGEIARRVTGHEPRDFVEKYLAQPLALDVQIGARESDWHRIATITPPPPGGRRSYSELVMKAISNPSTTPMDTVTPLWRKAQIPAVNGHAAARSVAKLWGAVGNGGEIDGKRVLSTAAIARMAEPISTRPDQMMGEVIWGAGVLVNRGGLFGPTKTAFGNVGFGGSYGYADPALGVGVSYTPNKLYPSVLQDPRGMALAIAVAECVGRAGS